MRTLFFNAIFFTGDELVHDKVLVTEGERIIGFADGTGSDDNALHINCRSNLVSAGLIDLQIAGGGGCLFSAHPTQASLAKIADAIVATGTTGFLLALPTNSNDVYSAAFKILSGNNHHAVLGLHLEGPFISVAKRGAHPTELIRKPSVVDINALISEAAGTIRMMTVAPEVCTPEIIGLLREAGITVSAGHSNATFREAMAGFGMGIETTTHLFNAMSALHHREPGLPGAVFISDSALASIIADGIHVDFSMLAIAKKIMKERLFLVSDAVEESDQGTYRHVRQDDRYTLPDGTLSGAKLTMLDAVRNCMAHAGIDRYEALRMATLYPARLIRSDDRGLIAAGARADLIMTDENMNLKGICFNGKMELQK